MKFSQFAGTSIVPLVSRIVLALAFVTVGYNKLMRDKVFTAQQAETLKTLGVSVTEVTAASASAAAPWAGSPTIVLASFQDTSEEGAGDETDAGTGEPDDATQEEMMQDEAAQDEAAQDDAAQDEAGSAPPESEAPQGGNDETAGASPATGGDASGGPSPGLPADGQYTARGVHSVTLLCHSRNWPMPTLMAYLAGITELLGGALVLVGFMTRIWALGLAFTMGVAFYFVSMGFNNVTGTNPFDFAQEIPKFNTAVSQLGLFALSFGLVLTGAGPLSLDRLLFGGGRRKKKGGMDIEYEDVDNSPSRAL